MLATYLIKKNSTTPGRPREIDLQTTFSPCTARSRPLLRSVPNLLSNVLVTDSLLKQSLTPTQTRENISCSASPTVDVEREPMRGRRMSGMSLCSLKPRSLLALGAIMMLPPPSHGHQSLTSASERAGLLSPGPEFSHYMVPPFFLFGGKLCSKGNI